MPTSIAIPLDGMLVEGGEDERGEAGRAKFAFIGKGVLRNITVRKSHFQTGRLLHSP